jgi:hypothetical protein
MPEKLPIKEYPKTPDNDTGYALTHKPFLKAFFEVQAMARKGDLAGLEKWKNGKGTRMTCSSTIPLGRYHQQCILALRAKAKASADRKAKREAKNGNGAEVKAPENTEATS